MIDMNHMFKRATFTLIYVHTKEVKHGTVRAVMALSIDKFCAPMSRQAVCFLGS